ncbi:hypothetical protein EDB80DRAFT_269390 [Ilyonectria destructans]|nr:hypothetical protein EDB80DRAFT_269390 [Ilyonectria destructans]
MTPAKAEVHGVTRSPGEINPAQFTIQLILCALMDSQLLSSQAVGEVVGRQLTLGRPLQYEFPHLVAPLRVVYSLVSPLGCLPSQPSRLQAWFALETVFYPAIYLPRKEYLQRAARHPALPCREVSFLAKAMTHTCCGELVLVRSRL